MAYDVYYQQNPFDRGLSEEVAEATHHNVNYEYDDRGDETNIPVFFYKSLDGPSRYANCHGPRCKSQVNLQ